MLNGQPSGDFFETHKMKIGYVGAEPFLIEGSIKDNLDYGHYDEGEISDEEYDQALQFSKSQEFIESFPEKMEYKISENGEGLSAGQIQRLAVARAVLVLPKLLILDEFSSNLDSETESEITESIKSLKNECTVVVVSHKLETLKYSDHIINLDKQIY